MPWATYAATLAVYAGSYSCNNASNPTASFPTQAVPTASPLGEAAHSNFPFPGIFAAACPAHRFAQADYSPALPRHMPAARVL